MTSFVDVFGGGVPPSELAYVAYSFGVSSEFVWPENYNGSNGLLVASIVELTATSAGLSITLPPADNRSVGADIILRNVGAESIEVLDQDLGSLTTIPAGEVKLFYITDNSDPAGSWGIFDYGAGTSSADASALAGFGMRVWAAKLVPDHAYITKNANYTIDVSDRNKLINFITGTSIATMPPAADVEAGFHVLIRNSSLGTITVDGNAAEPVDGGLTKELSPNESAIFVSDGGGWYTVGYGRDVEFTFSEFVVNAAAGDVVLSSSDVAGRMIRVSGTAVADIEVTLPAIDNIYFVNVESGMGLFTATFTTGSGDVAELSAEDRTVLYSDGTNVQVALTTALVTTLAIADGSAAAPSISFNLDPDTGIFRPGADQLGFAAQGGHIATVDTGGIIVKAGVVGIPSFSFIGDRDTGLYNAAANEIGVAIGGTQVAEFKAGTLALSGAGLTNPPALSFLTDPNTGFFAASIGNIGISSVGSITFVFTNTGLHGPDGTAANPTYTFFNDNNTGIYSASANSIGLSTNAVNRVIINDTGVGINQASPFTKLHVTHGSAGNPATSGTVDAAVAERLTVVSVSVDQGVTAAGNWWLQPRLTANFATNLSTLLNPNGGSVVIGVNSPAVLGLLQVNGDVNVIGASRRIFGDFSNATILSRTLFQTSTTNGDSNLGIIPNGTGKLSSLTLYGKPDVSNTAGLLLSGSDNGIVGAAQVLATRTGTGLEADLTLAGSSTANAVRIRNTTGNLDVDAFTRLGSDAPRIKTKKLTGTMSAAADTATNVAHGLTAGKIISITATCFSTWGGFSARFPPNDSRSAMASLYHLSYDGTNVNLTTGSAALSTNIRSQAFIVYVVYEE